METHITRMRHLFQCSQVVDVNLKAREDDSIVSPKFNGD